MFIEVYYITYCGSPSPNKRPLRKHTQRLSNPFPPKIKVDDVIGGSGSACKAKPDFVKQVPRFLFNFKFRRHWGEDSVTILPCRTGVYFANTCIRKEPVRFDSFRFRTFRKLIGSVRFGSIRFHSVPFGSIRFHSVPFGSIRFHSVPFGSIRFHSVRRTNPGSTRFGLRFSDALWLGPVRFGSVPRPVLAGSRSKRFGSVRFGRIGRFGSVSYSFLYGVSPTPYNQNRLSRASSGTRPHGHFAIL